MAKENAGGMIRPALKAAKMMISLNTSLKSMEAENAAERRKKREILGLLGGSRQDDVLDSAKGSGLHGDCPASPIIRRMNLQAVPMPGSSGGIERG